MPGSNRYFPDRPSDHYACLDCFQQACVSRQRFSTYTMSTPPFEQNACFKLVIRRVMNLHLFGSGLSFERTTAVLSRRRTSGHEVCSLPRSTSSADL